VADQRGSAGIARHHKDEREHAAKNSSIQARMLQSFFQVMIYNDVMGPFSNKVPVLFLGAVVCLLLISPHPASAQTAGETPVPKMNLAISFRQGTIKINDKVLVTVFVTNESDVPITSAILTISRPDFLLVYRDSCGASPLNSPIEIGALAPYSTLAQPLTLCFALETDTAVAGSYNILFAIRYEWDKNSDLVTSEKPVNVDLIGAESILGIPIGLAGFVLPGFIVLVILKRFSIPWVKDFDSVDRVIYSVIFSIILLGPFSWLGSQPNMPPWIVWLDFRQQVNLIHLVFYVLIGILIGTAIGLAYLGRSESAKKALADRTVTESDQPLQLIRKALLLNGKCTGRKVRFQKKEGNSEIYGYHYAPYNKGYIVFANFQLVLPRLPESVRLKVSKLAASSRSMNTDPKGILAVLKLLKDTDKNVFHIANYVLEMVGGKQTDSSKNSSYMILPPDLYNPPVEANETGYLFEIVPQEPV
jgi:hypothetical protein